MEIYIKLFEVLFPVFFVIGIGYYIGKKDKKFNTTFITNFAANVGSPAMIIYALNVKNVSFSVFLDYFFYYLLAIISFAVVGIIFLFFPIEANENKGCSDLVRPFLFKIHLLIDPK